MTKSDAKLKRLSEIFRMNNRKPVTDAIRLLRKEEPFEGAVSLLVSLYDRTADDEIQKAIENFLNDIKYQSAASEIIAEISHEWKAETIKMLVTSCWQSGLDYNSYSTELTELFMTSDYATAIECLTVISESAHSLSPEKRNKLIKLIDNKIISLNPEIKKLAIELKSFLT